MKQIFVRLTAVVLLVCMTLCACNTGNDTSSQDATSTASEISSEDTSSEETSSEETSSEEISSEEISSEETSSKETSSKDTSSKEEVDLTQYLTEDGFLDVQAVWKDKAIKPTGTDDSPLFAEGLVEGLKGYEINGGVYQVDAETLRRLAKTPVRGDGKLKWLGFNEWGTQDLEQPKLAEVRFVNDPIYMSMFLPSEGNCFMSGQVNAAFMSAAADKWVNIMTIGAVYKNYDYDLPDDAEITLCISDVNLALRTTKSDGWYEAINIKSPTVYNGMYYLPWPLEGKLGTYQLDGNRITQFDDHVEIKLKGSDFNATTAKKVSDEVLECVYHFWGQQHYFDCKGSEILGLASSIKIWVKEPQWSEHLVIGLGADWREKDGSILQAFESYKQAITSEPRMVIGHTVEPSKYEEIMDSKTVQKLLGMK